MTRQDVKKWFINNWLNIFAVFAPVVGSSWLTIKGFLAGILTWLDIVLIVIILILVLGFTIKLIWNNVSYRSYHYPWSKIRMTSNYEVLEKTVTYKRDSSDVLHYSRSMNIRSLSNQLEHIYDKYIWTGSQPTQVKIVPQKGISRIRSMSRIGIWNYFMITFQNHMVRGQTKELLYKWPDIASCKNSSPFFAASTDEPTKKLTLVLELGSEYANQEIVCEEFRAIESDYPISVQENHLNDQGVFTWEIPKVKRFRHYRIRWSWSVGQPAVEIE